MDTGPPEPILVRESDTLWVGYRSFDPGFPGWDSSEAIDYLDGHEGEPFGVLRFYGVTACTMGPPNDERLNEHPLHDLGLRPYDFHEVRIPPDPVTRWIVTLHDETLDVSARRASAAPMLFSPTAEEAVQSVREAG